MHSLLLLFASSITSSLLLKSIKINVVIHFELFADKSQQAYIYYNNFVFHPVTNNGDLMDIRPRFFNTQFPIDANNMNQCSSADTPGFFHMKTMIIEYPFLHRMIQTHSETITSTISVMGNDKRNLFVALFALFAKHDLFNRWILSPT